MLYYNRHILGFLALNSSNKVLYTRKYVFFKFEDGSIFMVEVGAEDKMVNKILDE